MKRAADASTGKLAGRWPVVLLRETDSTNQRALEWDGEPVVIVAERQTAGRGRLGRSWHGRPGEGLAFSLIVPDDLMPPLAEVSRLSLVAGLAVAEAIDRVAGVRCAIKWPNDVLLGGRKVAGVLVESVMRGGRLRLVIGVGVNVANRDFPPALAKRATSVALAAKKEVDPALLLGVLAASLARWLAQLRCEGFLGRIRDAWRARDAVLGKELVWVRPDGGKVVGRAEGIAADGQLLVRDGRGNLHAVLSGDVHLAADHGREDVA